LLKQLLRYVMSDEARHVAFGVLALQDYYTELSGPEIRERQEFAFEAAVRMRTFLQQEVWDRMGVPPRDVIPITLAAPTGHVPGDALLEDRPQPEEARPARRRRRMLREKFTELGAIQFRESVGHRRGVRRLQLAEGQVAPA